MTSPMMPQQAKSFLFQAFLRRNFESACTRPTGHMSTRSASFPSLSRGILLKWRRIEALTSAGAPEKPFHPR
ncbi:hypothetical protein TNCV_3956601, partial [Trichonephila clavipes]